ncbi:MAG TPA: rhodanese-like domain-containing protein [Candidatus Udaeobacter sp.]|jgi:rhodanese-related sulfurtransferase|nr:rhodanese-like domain-containing protein [Candidatus Udaeobacter sp.]
MADERIILDVRPAEAFAAGHLPGSGHLPESEWPARRSELPPREAEVLVVAESPERARVAVVALESLGYSRVRALETPLANLGADCVTSPARPLWRPTPWLASSIARFGAEVPAGPAADLASGSGRDAVFLAARGYDVEAWDRAPEALARAVELARVSGVHVTPVECDLEHDRPPLPRSRYALITCFRFLDRRLFARIREALIPGGIVIQQTYRRGQERFGRPKRAQYLLDDGELARAYQGFEILDSEERTPAEGPITAAIVARRADEIADRAPGD